MTATPRRAVCGESGIGHAACMAEADDARFREPAEPEKFGMRLYSWNARALYLGPAFGLTPHRNAVAVLAVALGRQFGVAADPLDPSAGHRRCRSVLIPPNTLHHLVDTADPLAFLYVDPCSRDLGVLNTLARDRTPRAAFDLEGEAELADHLNRLACGDIGWDEARRSLGAVVSTPVPATVDPRVKLGLDRLNADPGARLPLSELAHDAGLSESRFLHLFKEAVGVPFRRYKLWIAMSVAIRAIARGESLTTAALDAGFASSAHFSAPFRGMFGLEPSRLGRGQLLVIEDG